MIMTGAAAVQRHQVKTCNRLCVGVAIDAQDASAFAGAIERDEIVHGPALATIERDGPKVDCREKPPLGSIHPVVTSCTVWLKYRLNAANGWSGVQVNDDIFQFGMVPDVPASAGVAFHGGGGLDMEVYICIAEPAIRLPYMSRTSPGRKFAS
jgi:hypothetical protein